MAVLLLALALLVKMLVPTGYMVASTSGSIQIVMCTGAGPVKITMPTAVGDTQDVEHRQDHQGNATPCAFAGLAHSALSAVDPVLLATNIALIVTTAFRLVPQQGAECQLHRRPPSRGPPIAA